MIDEIKKDLENTMSKALDTLVRNIAKIRAGRPNPSLLDDIEADYFDTKTPIKQLANISVSDASTLTLNVWDKSAIAPIEKAIMESNLGLSPAVSGTNIHIKIPPLTEERRNDLIKILKKESENRKGPEIVLKEDEELEFLDSLEFKLTNSQIKNWEEIKKDLLGNKPMRRLLQGDVGSGKTIVAGLSALLAAKNKHQVAIMCPTEILAEQHFQNFSGWFDKFNLNVELLL